ncbi:hypothetical protein ACQ4PT_064870 [Festuca glaucescens]
MEAGDEAFKQIWVMYVVSTVLSPTTSNHVSNRCYPVMQKAQLANLMGSFVSEMVGLMGSLVQGWTTMCGDVGDLLENKFGAIVQGFLSGLSTSSAPAERVTRVGTSGTKGGYATRSDAAKTRNVLPEDNTFLDDVSDIDSSSDGDSSSDDDVGKYVVAPRKRRQVKVARSVGGDDPLLFRTAAEATASGSVVAPRKGKQVKVGRSVGGDDPLLFRTAPEATAIVTPIVASGSVTVEGIAVLEVSAHPDIPTADSDTDLIGDTAVPVFASESATMEATSVPDLSAPADTPPAAHISDVIEDNLVAQDIPQFDDTTRQAEPMVLGRHGSDLLHLAQEPVLDANKTGEGKKKLQPLRVKDKEIRLIVVEELGITTEMVQFSVPTSMKEAHDAKKATPKRKQISKGIRPAATVRATRVSPRLAKQRISAGLSKLGASPPIIDMDPVSPETSLARVEGVHANDAARVELNEGAANDAPGLDNDKGAAANPSLAPADARPPSPSLSKSRATDDVSIGNTIVLPVSITFAPSAVSSKPSIIDKEEQPG